MHRRPTLDDDARAELSRLAGVHRLRSPRIVDGRQGPRVVVDGREVLNLSANDYLGLAADPRLVAAGHAALDEAGAGAGASRLVVGNHREHGLLERAVEDWLGVGGVRLFNAGYAANVGVLGSLVSSSDIVFSDELNHASIIDGCRLSRARIVVYPHGDLAALDALMASAPTGGRQFIVSESLFSMDGDVVDVRGLAAIARRREAAWILDEAHAIGVLGPQGRGVAAREGVVPDVLVGTFGKALGGFGAFAATTRAIADLLWNRARSLVFSTGLPPALPAMARTAIEIVRDSEGDHRRQQVAAASRTLRVALDVVAEPATPIVPVVVGDDRRVMELTRQLLEQGIYAQGIRPPTVPEGTARLRLSLSASHDLSQLADAAMLVRNATR